MLTTDNLYYTAAPATLPTVRVVDATVDGGFRIVNQDDVQATDVLYVEPKK